MTKYRIILSNTAGEIAREVLFIADGENADSELATKVAALIVHWGMLSEGDTILVERA